MFVLCPAAVSVASADGQGNGKDEERSFAVRLEAAAVHDPEDEAPPDQPTPEAKGANGRPPAGV
jgi:hypothetical protein